LEKGKELKEKKANGETLSAEQEKILNIWLESQSALQALDESDLQRHKDEVPCVCFVYHPPALLYQF